MDLQPYPIFWSGTNCTGTASPADYASRTTNPWTQGSDNAIGLTAKSVFIPSNYTSVTLVANSGDRKSDLHGPYLNTDLTKTNWITDTSKTPDTLYTGSATLNSDPIATMKFDNTEPRYLVDSCLGNQKFIGPQKLTKYTPQSSACDSYMQNVYCAANPTTTPCACITNQADVDTFAKKAGIDLSVTCLNKECARNDSYKTNAMLTIPCSINLCKQTLTANAANLRQDHSQNVIYCSGHYFNQQGVDLGIDNGVDETPLPPENVKPTTEQNIVKKQDRSRTTEKVPMITWIMMAVGFLIMGILIVLFFSKSSKVNQDDQEDENATLSSNDERFISLDQSQESA